MASIYEDRNGGWVAQVNIGGKRRSRKFDQKRAAQRWARQEEAATDRAGKAPAAPKARLSDVVAEYVAAIGDMSRSKEGAITHIADLMGRRKLADLGVDAFREFATTREAEGAGPATIGQDLTYLHTILSTGGPLIGAQVEGPLAALAAARKVLGIAGKIARPQERKRRPTDAELLALRDFWARRRRGIPMWAITQFAVASAMRLSEITRIAWADFDEAARTVMIRDRKHPRSKSGNDQRVPLLKGPVIIGGELVDPVEIVRRQPKEEAVIFPYDAATISTSFTRACASCRITGLTFHDLRHDACSRLFEADYEIPQVALVSGHKDWNQLRRYTQIKPESLHREDAA